MSRIRLILIILAAFCCGQVVVAADPLQPARDALAKGNWQHALAVMPRLDPTKNSRSAFLLRSQIYVLQSDWFVTRKDYGSALGGVDAAMSDAVVARAGWQRFIVHRKRAAIFLARRAPGDVTAAKNELAAANALAKILKGQ